jgi:hypothetical protein
MALGFQTDHGSDSDGAGGKAIKDACVRACLPYKSFPRSACHSVLSTYAAVTTRNHLGVRGLYLGGCCAESGAVFKSRMFVDYDVLAAAVGVAVLTALHDKDTIEEFHTTLMEDGIGASMKDHMSGFLNTVISSLVDNETLLPLFGSEQVVWRVGVEAYVGFSAVLQIPARDILDPTTKASTRHGPSTLKVSMSLCVEHPKKATKSCTNMKSTANRMETGQEGQRHLNIIINAGVPCKVNGAVSGLPLLFDRKLQGETWYEDEEKRADGKRKATIESNKENSSANELNKLLKASSSTNQRIEFLKAKTATSATAGSSKDPVEVIEDDEEEKEEEGLEKEEEGQASGRL